MEIGEQANVGAEKAVDKITHATEQSRRYTNVIRIQILREREIDHEKAGHSHAGEGQKTNR